MGSMLRQAGLLRQYYQVLAAEYYQVLAAAAAVLSDPALMSDKQDVTSGWGLERAPTPVGPVHPPFATSGWGAGSRPPRRCSCACS